MEWLGLFAGALVAAGGWVYALTVERNSLLRRVKEFERFPTLEIRITPGGALELTPRNTRGITATNIIAIWCKLLPPNLAVNDTLSIER